MVEVLDVFTAMDRAMEARGYVIESDHYNAESFGYRSRLYRKSPQAALSLDWEARDEWFNVTEGIAPWRIVATYRGFREGNDSPEAIVAALLREVDAAI